MCQHVRGRRAGSSQRGGGQQAGVGLRVPGVGSPASPWLVVDAVAADHRCLRTGCRRSCGGRGAERARERRERGRVAEQEAALLEDPRQVGQPRWSAGGVPDDRGPARERRLLSGPPVGDRKREALGLEEAWAPESLQPRPGGGRSRALGDGAQQSGVQDRLHPPAWPQGGGEATHRWKDALFSRSLAAGIQVGLCLINEIVERHANNVIASPLLRNVPADVCRAG